MRIVNQIVLNKFSISGSKSDLDVSFCLDHTISIIQNFSLDNYSNKGFIEAEYITRDRKDEKHVRGFLTERKAIEDFDDIDNVKRAFSSWLQNYKTHPMIAECINPDGNKKVYFRLKNRFTNPERNIRRLSEALNNYTGTGVFLTLTYEHKISLRDAWDNISKDWNRFLTRLKIERLKLEKEMRIKEYPALHYIWISKLEKEIQNKLHYIRVLEAQGNGYPHIHVLFFGIDYLYDLGNKKEWQNDNPHSKNIKHFWERGSVFINRTSEGKKIEKPINYMMKYIRKTFTESNDKAELTKSMLWTFDKRSWDTSRGLMQFLKSKPRIDSGLILQGIHIFERLHGEKTIIIWIERKAQIGEIVEYNAYEIIKLVNRGYSAVKNDYG